MSNTGASSLLRNRRKETTCAACRHFRTKCEKDCPYARYFPVGKEQEFFKVHKLYGASNFRKFLKQAPSGHQDMAAQTMIFCAEAFHQDPSGGCRRIADSLTAELQFYQSQLQQVLSQLEHYRAGFQQQQLASIQSSSDSIASSSVTSRPTSLPCAACTHFGRICDENCRLAKYFPQEKLKEFLDVEKLYGTDNFLQLMDRVPEHQRPTALASIIFCAQAHARDPVGGCKRIIDYLEAEIMSHSLELCYVQAQIAYHKQAELFHPLPPTQSSDINFGQANSNLASASYVSPAGTSTCSNNLIDDPLARIELSLAPPHDNLQIPPTQSSSVSPADTYTGSNNLINDPLARIELSLAQQQHDILQTPPFQPSDSNRLNNEDTPGASQ